MTYKKFMTTFKFRDFIKIKSYFDDQKNSLTSLNHALVNDGIFLEVKENYSFKKPLINKESESVKKSI